MGMSRPLPTRPVAGTLVAILAIVAVAVAARSNVYLMLDGGDGAVLWNADEADFFIGVRHIGHEVNCLRYPWFLAKSYLGAVEDPDRDRGSLAVIRVTSSDVERSALNIPSSPPGSGPDMYTPLEGRIYLNYPALGGLCRWSGDHFEPVTPEERRRLDDIGDLSNKDIDHGASGWSKRSFQVEPGDSDDAFTIEAGNHLSLSVSDMSAVNGNRVLSISLLRRGRAPEKIWQVELRYGKVSKAEYLRVFQNRE
jgi:hypothetical protein